jgi:fructokinase
VIVVGGEALVDVIGENGLLRPVPGGGPFNTAIALARLDVPVAYLGTLSRDDYGQLLATLLSNAGVEISLVRWSEAPTPLAMVQRHADGESSYTFYLAATSLVDFPADEVPELPQNVWGIHVGTLALAIDPPAAAYEALLDREGSRRTIVLDPNIRPKVFGDPGAYRSRFERLAHRAEVVKLSDDDAAWIYPGLDVDAVIDRLLSLGPRLVALTLGSTGAITASEIARARTPALQVDVLDTVGAGDSFGAALTAVLSEQQALGPNASRPLDEQLLQHAATYAITAAAITCTRTGAVPPSRAEVDRWIGTPHGS